MLRKIHGRRRTRPPFTFEALEGRRLLSIYTGPSSVRPVITPGAIYQITVTGGGTETVHQMSRGLYALDLFGTTASSTVTVSLLRSRGRHAPTPLQLGGVDVQSGALGSIEALGTADLVGAIAPVSGLSSLQLDGIGPNAHMDINGSLGGLSVANNLDLGPNGQIDISGNVTGPISVGNFQLDGGAFLISGDVTGAVNVNDLTVEHGGLLSVGRDWTGGLAVAGDLTLDSGGNIFVGREFDNLTVNGDFLVQPTAGALSVGGDLTNLTVVGAFQGKGTSVADLNVGLNLNNLVVNGGGANQGGLQHVNINVGKDIDGFDVEHGVFNSIINAGVTINGAPQSGGANIGPDGADAVFDSQIIAGVSILNFLIDGNVQSDYVTNPNPTGPPTRIIAGENRAGVFSANGLIDNFQITGALIDSVLAASVQPNGGNGSLPVQGYGTPVPTPSNTPGDGGFNTYDAPAGTITGGTVGNPIPYPNYTELSYYNETLTGVSYDTAIDPTIDDFIFPGGAINPSFASPPVASESLQQSTTVLPLPTNSTVLGGVISTSHGDNFDYAGIFAANTSGVFVGNLPEQSS